MSLPKNDPYWKWWLARIFGKKIDYWHEDVRIVGALWRGIIYVRQIERRHVGVIIRKV